MKFLSLLNKKRVGVCAGSLILGASAYLPNSAHGQAIAVPNFSFETPVLTDGAVSVATGTTAYNFTFGTGDTAGIVDYPQDFGQPSTGPLLAPADGVNDGFINGINTITTAASLGSVTLGTTYTLTVAVGRPSGQNGAETFSINLLVGGVAATAFAPVAETSIPNGTFEDFTTSFAAAAGQDGLPLTAQLAGIGGGDQITFDNIQVVATVPEPGAWVMMLGGLGMLGLVQRLRRTALN